MYFTSAYAVSCGEDRFSVTCSLCPKGNIINGHDWCAGNCYFDDEIGICKEKSKFGYNYKVWRFTTNKSSGVLFLYDTYAELFQMITK